MVLQVLHVKRRKENLIMKVRDCLYFHVSLGRFVATSVASTWFDRRNSICLY